MEKVLYIYAGCNGAGKTTAFESTSMNNNNEIYDYLNSDSIAKGISPFNPESVSIKAGKLLFERLNELLLKEKTFALETTLAGRTYKHYIEYAKTLGYRIVLFYYWLISVDLAKERVRLRVSRGGHNIPEIDIERRYFRGINNLFSLYLPIVDSAFLYDNTNKPPSLFAEYEKGKITIINFEKYNQLQTLWNTMK